MELCNRVLREMERKNGMEKSEQTNNDQEKRMPDESSKNQAKVSIITASTRQSENPDPISNYVNTGRWKSKGQAEEFYHTHPEVFQLEARFRKY